jgi:hypothetical protein
MGLEEGKMGEGRERESKTQYKSKGVPLTGKGTVAPDHPGDAKSQRGL